MKPFFRPLLFLSLALVAFAGCSTIESRISKNQAQFDGWPADVREKIRAGRLDVGFTPAQVLVTLGEPQRKYTRTTAKGVSEVWAYTDGRSGFSVGVGVSAASRGPGAYTGGVFYDPSGYDREGERVRVVFEDGVVASVEARAK